MATVVTALARIEICSPVVGDTREFIVVLSPQFRPSQRSFFSSTRIALRVLVVSMFSI
jgi:hypothetical protein